MVRRPRRSTNTLIKKVRITKSKITSIDIHKINESNNIEKRLMQNKSRRAKFPRGRTQRVCITIKPTTIFFLSCLFSYGEIGQAFQSGEACVTHLKFQHYSLGGAKDSFEGYSTKTIE